MQALRSQTTRNLGTCRGASCTSHSTAVARRATTIVLKRQWPLGTPSSTFLYTAIFVSGLAIDGRAKQKRNKQWDSAFAGLAPEQPAGQAGASKDSTITKEETPTSSTGHRRLEEALPNSVDWTLVHRTAGLEVEFDQSPPKHQDTVVDHQHQSYHPSDLWDILRFDSKLPTLSMPDLPVHTGSQIMPHNLPPQSLWAYADMRRKALKARQTWKKLAIQEVSIGLLIRSLLERAKVGSLSNETVLALRDDSMGPNGRLFMKLLRISRRTKKKNFERLNGMLWRLQHTSAETIATSDELRTAHRVHHSRVPEYGEDNDGRFHEIREQMNYSIKRIFDETDHKTATQDDLALATLKICYNLLVSSAAPNVQTFNILLIGFGRWNSSALVTSVGRALKDCKIRPNEITCSSILNHYIEQNDPASFSQFVAKMRAFDKALMLARPDINVNEASQGRLVRLDESKVFQKVHPTPMVFNSMMSGVLKFAGFERALDIYYEMQKDGWGLDVLGLSHFLDDCVKRIDWSGGLYIWQEINSIKRKANRSHLAKAYAHMLALCTVSGQTAAFNSVLQEVVQLDMDRKRIITSAMTMSGRVRSQQGAHIPAFTADNVLIAVSDYVEDYPRPQAKDVLSSSTPEPKAQTHPESNDPKDTWEAWLEQELGGRTNATMNSEQAVPAMTRS